MSCGLKDGTGTGNLVKVDDQNRVATKATALTASEDLLVKGELYAVSTATITLTSDSKSAIFYLKNNEESDILVEEIALNTSTSTGGTGKGITYSFLINPTGGTLLTNEVAAINFNLNAGSSNLFDTDAYQGVEADTLTGPVSIDFFIPTVGAVYKEFSPAVLPKGTSIGIAITPPTGNTSILVTYTVRLYKVDQI